MHPPVHCPKYGHSRLILVKTLHQPHHYYYILLTLDSKVMMHWSFRSKSGRLRPGSRSRLATVRRKAPLSDAVHAVAVLLSRIRDASGYKGALVGAERNAVAVVLQHCCRCCQRLIVHYYCCSKPPLLALLECGQHPTTALRKERTCSSLGDFHQYFPQNRR
jgi:hypothetical protein